MDYPMPAPLSAELKSETYRVTMFAAKIMRQDDKRKVSRLVREYQKAAERLLSVALADREARVSALPAAGSSEADR